MTQYQRRVEATARAYDRAEKRFFREHPNVVNLAMLGHFRARWHLRHGGRAPGETCGTCLDASARASGDWPCCACAQLHPRLWRRQKGASDDDRQTP